MLLLFSLDAAVRCIVICIWYDKARTSGNTMYTKCRSEGQLQQQQRQCTPPIRLRSHERVLTSLFQLEFYDHAVCYSCVGQRIPDEYNSVAKEDEDANAGSSKMRTLLVARWYEAANENPDLNNLIPRLRMRILVFCRVVTTRNA